MKQKNSITLDFYKLLGRVFYATAQADSEINEKEIETLKRVLNEQWLELENDADRADDNAALQIEIVFDNLLENEVIEENTLDDFEEFKAKHPDLFTTEMSKLIMDTASKIASSFAKRNKSELVFLSRLWLILKED